MKRDLDLVRAILLKLEADAPVHVDGYSDEVVAHHVHLMGQAGLLLVANITSVSDTLPMAAPLSITWAGHEFIHLARDNGIWKKAQEKVLRPAVGAVFEVLLTWLKAEAKKHAGLP